MKTSVPIRIENTKPKASSGLYGSLPLVLAANKAAGSSSTVKSSSTSKPPAPKNVDKVPNPMSLGAFLQSILEEKTLVARTLSMKSLKSQSSFNLSSLNEYQPCHNLSIRLVFN